ncbi:MAG: L-aspartate oxidase, partial [Acidobacteriaceae bacterium]
LGEIRGLSSEIPQECSRSLLELRNLQTVGALILRAAMAREESRGAHYRNDFPQRDDPGFGRHSVIRQDEVTFEEF